MLVNAYRAERSKNAKEEKVPNAQTAKGTPFCKHRLMPSETLVRSSSHSSTRPGCAGRAGGGNEKTSSEKTSRLTRFTPNANRGVFARLFDDGFVPRLPFGSRLCEPVLVRVGGHLVRHEVVPRPAGFHVHHRALASQAFDVLRSERAWGRSAVRLFSFVALAFSAAPAAGAVSAGSLARSDRDHATPSSSSSMGRDRGRGRTCRSTTSTRLLALLAPRSWRHSADGNAVSHRDDGCGATASASAPRAMHEAIAPRRRERRPEVLHASRAARAASQDIGGTVGT